MNRDTLGTVVGVVIFTVAAAMATGCNMVRKDSAAKTAADGGKMAVAMIKPSVIPATRPAMGAPTGKVTFKQQGDRVHVHAELQGLRPDAKHGFHIHAKGDVSAPDLSSAGGHFDPDKHAHGGPTTSPVHAGDLGNLQADAQGHATLDLTVDNISIGTGAANDVVGKAVIVHAKQDDLKTQPTGNSGERIGGGVIELK